MDVSQYVLSSEALLEKYAPLINDRSDCLWGQYIRKGAVTAIIGETSAGKTTLLHNMAYKLAQGEPFLTFTPPRPLKIFYCDFESYNAVLAEHLIDIGVSDQWHFFNKEASDIVPRGVMLITVLGQLLAQTPYDILVIDPLMDADPIDENDNTAASIQVSRWRDLARKYDCAVVLVHNTGKSSDGMTAKDQAETAMYRASRKHSGRGASSRSDRYDIQLNYVVADPTTRILKCAKTRSRNLGDHWMLKFSKTEFGFEVDKFEHGQSHSHSHVPIENEKMRMVAQFLHDHQGTPLKTIYTQYVKPVMPISQATFYRYVAACSQPVTPSNGVVSAPTADVPLPQTVHTPAPPLLPEGSTHTGGTSSQIVDLSMGAAEWRSPHHVGGSYGRFVGPFGEPRV